MTIKDKKERVKHADAKIVDFVVGKRSHRGSTTNMSLDKVSKLELVIRGCPWPCIIASIPEKARLDSAD